MRMNIQSQSNETTSSVHSSADLSTGAIVGIVIASVFGVIAVIILMCLLRHFFNRLRGHQRSSDKCSVAYTQSDFNGSTLSSDLSTSYSGDLQNDSQLKNTELPSNVSVQTPRNNGTTILLEKNDFLDSGQNGSLNQTDSVDLSPKSSQIGFDNPTFVSEDGKTQSLSPAEATVGSMKEFENINTTPTVDSNQLNILTQNKHLGLHHLDSSNNSFDSLSSFSQTLQEGKIRRSYHFDRSMVSAIAAQRCQDAPTADVFNFPKSKDSDEITVIFKGRMAF